jgi:uncharacterized protein (TIGR02145 family)
MEIIGSKILNYNILSLIGEGGMASVYLGEHERLGTKVAIKVLNPILSVNAQLRERFLNEARLMASLDHPNITKVIDFEDEGNLLCIIMEHLEGEDLSDKIKRDGALSIEQINNIYSQVLSGFNYAHNMGIVHRDIKPSNIFIKKDGIIKILDFGIAKLFGQGNEMTQTGTQMGTPVYMSPEQVKADKSIDHRSDIYSLGVTLYYACYGHSPYDSSTLSQFDILSKIVHEPLPEMQDHPFKNLILTACAKDRENRFQSCEEWIAGLNYLNQLLIQNPSIHITQDKIVINTTLDSSPSSTPSVDHLTNSVTPESNPTSNSQPSIQHQEKQSQKIKRVKYKNQIWMVENLAVTHFRNGDALIEARSNEEWINAGKQSIPAFCRVNNSSDKQEIYGLLYNWYALNDPRGLAPKGWKIPSKRDFETLISSIGGAKRGDKLKNHQGWALNNGIPTEYFQAMPAGTRSLDGEFKKEGYVSAFWTNSQSNEFQSIALILIANNNLINLTNTNVNRGLSIRCIEE